MTTNLSDLYAESDAFLAAELGEDPTPVKPEPQLPLMICPSCHGARQHRVMVCYRSKYGGCEERIETCDACQGSGEITEEQARQIEQGHILRHFRVHEKKWTQREAGQIWGVDFTRLAKMEAGRVPIPTELWEKIEREDEGAPQCLTIGEEGGDM